MLATIVMRLYLSCFVGVILIKILNWF